MKLRGLLRTLLIILVIAAPSGELAAGKLYKWVDENGAVHYGDKIPPEYTQQGHTELNKQGVTVKSIEGPKTEAQLTEEQHRQQALEAEKHRAADQTTRDRTLLSSYTSEHDITQVRDRKLATVAGEISMHTTYRGKLEPRLAAQTKEADQFAKQGAPVPEKLQNDILDTKAQIEKYTTFIKIKQTEQETIRQQAENDLQRFRELKTSTAPQP
ncbi:MAG: DUF4124 domain-containing protein [Gammaproteobacteria bacterium]|nr:DUF4124 domain-containing protein [Gammaproteobacteria bacterium]